MRGKYWLWLCVLLMAGLMACGRAEPAPLPTVEVTLGIFSGLPDPVWTLTPEQTRTLLAKLDTLPVGPARDDMGGLGYHGFYVRVVYGNDRGEEWITIFDSAVHIEAEGQDVWKADPRRTLERWLLELTTDQVDAALVSEAQSALAPAITPTLTTVP